MMRCNLEQLEATNENALGIIKNKVNACWDNIMHTMSAGWDIIMQRVNAVPPLQQVPRTQPYAAGA